MPVFALANAGAAFSADMELDFALMMHIAVALFIGKGIGITVISYLGVKFKIVALPQGSNFKQIIGIAILAGVGFTMSIFIASLAYEGNAMLIDALKVGIIIGSTVSGIAGYLILRWSGNSPNKELKG